MYFEPLNKGLTYSQEEEIYGNIKMGRIISEVKELVKPKECLYCGKPVTSCCNSHTIPRYCLKNICLNGEVTGPNAIFGLPRMGYPASKQNLGLNETGTFFLICNECDNHAFQDYEDPANYSEETKLSQKMMAQIAIKNYLSFIYKRKQEIALMEKFIYSYLANPRYDSTIFTYKKFQEQLPFSYKDLNSYMDKFHEAKKYNETGKGPGFFLLYYQLLDYVAPISIQVPLAVPIDMEGNFINDIYCNDPKYKAIYLHVCVFPQKEKTAVILFTDANTTRYSKFRRQLFKLDQESQLGVINYLIFLHCEDYYMAKEIGSRVDLESLFETANTTLSVWDAKPLSDKKYHLDKTAIAKKFSLGNWNCIPNLLSKKNKLR